MNTNNIFTKTAIATVVAASLGVPAMAADTRLTSSPLSASTIRTATLAPVAGELEETKTRTISGQTFTFVKKISAKGEVSSVIYDSKGNLVDPRLVPVAKVERVDAAVSAWINKMLQAGAYSETLRVDIALELPVKIVEAPVETGAGEIADGQIIEGIINGRSLKAGELELHVDRMAAQQTKTLMEQAQARSVALAEWASRHGLLGAEGMKLALLQDGSAVSLQLNAEQLNRLIKSGDPVVVGIEPTPVFKDTIDDAMVATNIQDWALPFAANRGDDIGIYMTESGCAQNSRFDNYTRLAGSETDHSRNVGGIIKAVAPESYLYCRGSAVLPQNSDLDGVSGNPPIYVVNRSNGGNYSTNYNTTDRDWDNFSYNNLLAMHVSAGNEGNDGGFVISPAKGLNITTVGNYNDTNDTISSGSSFLDPGTGNDKPELSAPGSSITAGGFTMSGTSMSSPHAAAFVADMMSQSTYLKYRPYLAKAKLIAGATDAITGGYDKVGKGGIDFLSAQRSGYWSWWSGGNGSWNYFDGLDNNNDGYVTRRVYINKNWDRVRVALAWMNRGSYTYDNRNNAHPIGMDLDLSVLDPNGNWVGSSASWDNPFESVDFIPAVSGYYTFRVKRYANRDTSSAVRMGLYVNYYNQ